MSAAAPAQAPPAPWRCVCEALLWIGPPSEAAVRALPPALRGARALFVLGGFVRYHETPVGAYDEVFASVAVLRGRRLAGHVPFMAVDSPQSVAGGRGNWALPKVLASFSGDLASISAAGEAWSVSASASGAPLPGLPLAARASNVQEWPDGVLRAAGLRARGRCRPALVRVSASGAAALAGEGLRPGVLLERASFVLGEPR